MGTTNILDLNNRVDELEKSYPASQVMMSDGTTSVEEAVDEVASGISKIYTSNNIAGNGTMTFNLKKSYCHMIFSTRNNAISMIAYGNLIDMVNQSNLSVTVGYEADYDKITITNNNVSSTNIVVM